MEWKSKTIEIKEIPSKHEIKIFCLDFRTKTTQCNKDAKWLPKIEQEYCKNVNLKSCKINVGNF